jgi:ABC-type branched-subunit amino acid transport system substrate-binding protein
MGWAPNVEISGHAYAAYILREKPGGKIAVLYQNDDFGKDYPKGIKDGLGDKAGMIILAAAYEAADPTIDCQVIAMKAASADVFVNTALPRFAAQAIRKAAEIKWKPLHILSGGATSVSMTLRPAGVENAIGDRLRLFYEGPDRPAVAGGPVNPALPPPAMNSSF